MPNANLLCTIPAIWPDSEMYMVPSWTGMKGSSGNRIA